jgi:uncharacterized protein (TIGR02996 family)
MFDSYLKSFPQEERVFIDEIMFDTSDEGARMVYADWLIESEDPRGEFLTLDLSMNDENPDSDRYRELGQRRGKILAKIDKQWAAMMARCPIENCLEQIRVQFVCPLQWEKLKPFDVDQTVRYCDLCGKTVHYCLSMNEARDFAGRGQCVAIDPSVARSSRDLDDTDFLMGVLIIEPQPND